MKIGLFGGTFDPIHNGHVKVAQTARQRLGLDRIIFIPSGNPPHKTGQKITDKKDRLAMVRLAAEAEGNAVSTWELDQDKKSYSVDMIKHFQMEYAGDELFFIIGADSFYDLPTWYHYRELLRLCQFVVVSRPDTAKARMLDLFDGTEPPPRVFFLEDLHMDISSTDIRAMIREGKDVSRLVPPSVLQYIKTRKLYQED